ncbi:MAG TPA: TatD family hydrolase [Candidatus Kapabacteria bacterium]|nr:TatD family hydrolase [Candidatus Kapabacteria bacterium]
MIDTHSHIFVEQFDNDRDEMLERAFSMGIENIIMPAIEPSTFDNVIKLAEHYEQLYCAIGVHPQNAQSYDNQAEARIHQLVSHPKVKAIGEIGLDYYYDYCPKEKQKEAFLKQIRIAKEYNLPIIVHNRDASEDIISIINQEQDGNLRGVMHCFSQDIEFMNKSLDLGFNISFTGNITYKNANDLREVVKLAPLDKIMLETDAPWMAPIPYRGKRNEPSFIIKIAEKIAEIKSISINEVKIMTTKTAKLFFSLASIIMFFIFTSTSYSQSNANNNEYENEDSLEQYENPVKKFIGLGPIMGINTIVETYYPESQDISHDGLFAAGGTILYGGAFDWVIAQLSLIYSYNTKPTKDTKIYDSLHPLPANEHYFTEFTLDWVVNPHSRVNFYLISGISNITNIFSQYDSLLYPLQHRNTINKTGLITGLGFFVNIPIKNAGLFCLNAEWRLNFMLSHTKRSYDPRYNPPDCYKPSDITTFYSIPRFGIIWFPPFKQWF